MDKLLLALKSRATWTLIVMFAFNFIPHLPIDQATKDLINGLLTLLVGYFHLNPSQNYTQQ